jgi:serine protease Do
MRCVAAILVTAVFSPMVSLAQQPRTSAVNAPPAVAQIEQSLVDVIVRAEPSVVAISRQSAKSEVVERSGGNTFGEYRRAASEEDDGTTVAAGVIIDRSGLVLTQYLAVREGDQHSVTTIDRKTYPATVRGADPKSGLAVLAIDTKARASNRKDGGGGGAPGSFPAIAFGDAAALRKGQFVIAIGNPFAIRSDGQPTASWGTVTNFARKAPLRTNLNDAPGPAGDFRTTLHHLGTLIQTDAKLGFSTGGGALVNLRGELVGVTTTAATIAGHEQPAGYAIPINTAFRRIIDTLKQGREVEYGMLGVGFGQTPFDATGGNSSRLTVLQVYPGSPATRAGLAAGDVVTRVGDQQVNDVDGVQLAISLLPPSTTTTIDYVRSGRPASARVTLAKLAVSGKKIVTEQQEAWKGIRVDYPTALEATELETQIASGALDQEGCVLVTDVREGSDAWKAGVRKGTFISHVGGKRITTPAEFHAAARELGDKFDIRLTKPIEPDTPPNNSKR